MNLDFTRENLSIGKILDISWKLFTENIKQITIIVVFVYIPINLILLVIDNTSPDMGIREYMRIINFLESLIGIIATLGIVVFISKKINNEEMSPQDSLIQGLDSYGKVIWVNIITGIMIVLLTLLFIIPGIIFGTYWMFVTYIVLLHKKNSSGSREYSKNIILGRWWKAFWYSIVFGLLAILVAFGLGFIKGFTYGFMEGLYHFSIADWIYLDNTLNFLWNTVIDICLSFFTVVSFIFFLAFDATKEDTNNGESIPELANINHELVIEPTEVAVVEKVKRTRKKKIVTEE